MEAKPKITLIKSSLDKVLETGSVIIICILWVLTVFAYVQLPNTIVVHFNELGKPDSYGSKTTLLLLPFIATIIFWLLTFLSNHPHVLNYAKKITQENAARQYEYATRMLRFLKFSIATVFTLIVLFTYLATLGTLHGPGRLFLPFVITLINIPTAYFIIKSLTNKSDKEKGQKMTG